MKAVILRCSGDLQRTTFHFGSSGQEGMDEIVHSDTLMSALIVVCARAFGEKAASDMAAWFTRGDVRLSSTMYALEREDKSLIWFLPKPMCDELETPQAGKEKLWKKLHWYSLGVWIRRPTPDQALAYPSFEGGFAVLPAELPNGSGNSLPSFRKTSTAAHTAVHKETKEDSFYYFSRIHPIPVQAGIEILKPHLWFLLESQLTAREEYTLHTCIRLLADEGMGAERSTGSGHFAGVEIINAPALPATGERYCTLSLTIPEDATAFDTFTHYRLTQRGGRGKYSPEHPHSRRKKVQMITEGSVCTATVAGKVVELSAGRIPILRNGLCLSIPLPSR